MSPASYLTAPPRVAPRAYHRSDADLALEMTRVAAIDLGSNATRLLVADVVDGRTTELVRRTRITRLGEGVDERRRLLPAPIARVRNVLADYRREAESLGAEWTLAIATSAVRDADNGEAFLGEIEWSYGFATRLLSGDEEAALTLRGVGPLEPGAIVTDIGGGSTEIAADGFRHSLQIGCVRLAERFGSDLDAAAAAVRAALPAPPFAVRTLVGVDGTTAELAALRGCAALDGRAVDEELARLAASSDEERQALLLEPDRSSVIVVGAVILRELLRGLGAERVVAGERDILDGAVLEAAALGPQPDDDAPAGAFTCC
jgi:exopolyphosphatase / guanosine-5'-triphosphate,3'-diphosphate pyrophosphatase